MDVVIPLGGEQNFKHEELRYALRSLERYMGDLGRVFIVGSLPIWAQNLEHIDCDDFGPDPVANVMKKFEAVCKDERVSADFLMTHDDIFALDSFLGENLPFYASKKGRGSVASDINFAMHTPIRLNKGMWHELFSKIPLQKGVSPRSFYCNFYGAEATEYKECVVKAAEQPEKIAAQLKGQPFCVVNNRAFGHPEFVEFMGTRFAERSAFECA
jgi:hypothetical protein